MKRVKVVRSSTGDTVRLNDQHRTLVDFDVAESINGMTSTERCSSIAFLLSRSAIGGPFEVVEYERP